MAKRQPTASAGKKLGRYVIERELGRGGMGVVYVAADENLGRKVALKTTAVAGLGSGSGSRDQRRARFVREVKALAQVNHQNVVHVYDSGEADDPDLGWVLFYSMEYVEGITLAQLVQQQGALEPGAAAAVCMQVSAGLGAAHRSGIVHRDVKPANIFIARDRRALIGDFGICKIEGSTQITRRDQLVGTPNYLAPEQILGEDIVPATDVFALGALFYVIATNRPLREKVDAASLLAEASTDEPKKRVQAAKEIPGPLRKIIARALERDPKKRFASCAEFAEALSEHATRIPLIDGDQEEPAPSPVTLDGSNTAPGGAPSASGESFAGTGAAGIDAIAEQLLSEVKAGAPAAVPEASAPAPAPAPAKDPALPVAQTESTVMFNLRNMEEEESKKTPAAKPKNPFGTSSPAPVTSAAPAPAPAVMSSTTPAASDTAPASSAPPPSRPDIGLGATGASPSTGPGIDAHDDVPTDFPMNDTTAVLEDGAFAQEATPPPGLPTPPATPASAPSEPSPPPPVARQPKVKVKELPRESMLDRLGQMPLSPAAWYASAAALGVIGGLLFLGFVALLFGGSDESSAALGAGGARVVAAAPKPKPAAPPPESCASSAASKREARLAAQRVDEARELFRAGKEARARRAIATAVALDPANADAHALHARILADDGEWTRSEVAYRCVMHLAPDSVEAQRARKALAAVSAR